MARYPNRMVDVADVSPSELIPHPDNWRLHSELQKDSVDQALASIGTLQRIVVNKPTGRVIDGHLRLALAIEHGEETVPVQYVELDESEEAAALATFDPLGDMAHEDAKKLRLNIERANLDWLPKSGVGDLLSRLAPPKLPPRLGDHPDLPDGVEEVEPESVHDRLRSLQWFGGKSRSLNRLLPLLDVPAEMFIDACGGAANVLLNRDRARVEVYNDADGDVVHFFRTLRDRGDELQEALRLTPYAREEHELAKESTDEDIERARRFFVSVYQSIGAVRHNTFLSPRTTANPAGRQRSLVDDLGRLVDRLRGVNIEQRDVVDLIAELKEPGALIYVDPPYVSERRSSSAGYEHELDREGHQRLLEACIASPALVAVSGYPSDQYDEALADWRVAGWAQPLTSASVNGREVATREERVWMNYNAQGVRIV